MWSLGPLEKAIGGQARAVDSMAIRAELKRVHGKRLWRHELQGFRRYGVRNLIGILIGT